MKQMTQLIGAMVVALVLGGTWLPGPAAAEHGNIHALLTRSLEDESSWTQQMQVASGEELYLVLKSDVPFGPVQVSLGNLPLAATFIEDRQGPWQTVKLSAESPTDIDAVEWDTSQSDAAVLKIRVNQSGPGREFGVLDARLTVRWAGSTSAADSSMIAQASPSDSLRSDATAPPPSFVTGLDASLDAGWLQIQCYCWRGAGVEMPTINLREARGDWSYSWRPDPGTPTIFRDLPRDAALIVEIGDRSAIAPGQPTRWDGIYLAEHGAVIYFVLN